MAQIVLPPVSLDNKSVNPRTVTATIQGGSSVSDDIIANGWRLSLIALDASFAGTSLMVESSVDLSAWLPVYDRDGRVVLFEAGPSYAIVFPYEVGYALEALRLVSNTSQAAGTPSNLTLMFHPPQGR